jgi:hypothetical protein
VVTGSYTCGQLALPWQLAVPRKPPRRDPVCLIVERTTAYRIAANLQLAAARVRTDDPALAATMATEAKDVRNQTDKQTGETDR